MVDLSEHPPYVEQSTITADTINHCINEANALRRAFCGGSRVALARIGRFLPMGMRPNSGDCQPELSTGVARWIVARERGFGGWGELLVELTTAASAASYLPGVTPQTQSSQFYTSRVAGYAAYARNLAKLLGDRQPGSPERLPPATSEQLQAVRDGIARERGFRDWSAFRARVKRVQYGEQLDLLLDSVYTAISRWDGRGLGSVLRKAPWLINTPGYNGTPLKFALSRARRSPARSVPVLEVLIKFGALLSKSIIDAALDLVESSDPLRFPAFLRKHPAVAWGTPAEWPSVLEWVISRGFRDNSVSSADALAAAGSPLDRPLLYASALPRADWTGYLLVRGANPNAVAGVDFWPRRFPREGGLTPLRMAVLTGSHGCASLLVNHGARRDTFWLAAATGDMETLRASFRTDGVLTPKATEDRPDFGDVCDNAEAPSRIPDPQAVVSEAFALACWHGRLETAVYLRDRGATVDFPLYDGRTPLHLAARAGHRPIAELLLASGADPTRRETRYRMLPWELARERGFAELGEYLRHRAERFSPGPAGSVAAR